MDGRALLSAPARAPAPIRLSPRADPGTSASPEGEVLELGTHDELMAANGRYAETYELQAAAYRVTT
jgi:hypothetical protein